MTGSGGARSNGCRDFDRIDGELRAYDEKREQVIKRSRDIQKLSKQVSGCASVAGQVADGAGK